MLGKLAKTIALNGNASMVVGLFLLALTLTGFGGWAWTSHQLDKARASVVPISEAKGRAEGQLTQLAADTARRTAEANAAIAVADKAAQRANAQAKDILAARPSNPNDLCASASELVDAQLRAERP